jgi:hypothetical protein
VLPADQAWESLPGSVRGGGRPSREEALQAVAVLNRVRRLLSETSGEGPQLMVLGGESADVISHA